MSGMSVIILVYSEHSMLYKHSRGFDPECGGASGLIVLILLNSINYYSITGGLLASATDAKVPMHGVKGLRSTKQAEKPRSHRTSREATGEAEKPNE